MASDGVVFNGVAMAVYVAAPPPSQLQPSTPRFLFQRRCYSALSGSDHITVLAILRGVLLRRRNSRQLEMH